MAVTVRVSVVSLTDTVRNVERLKTVYARAIPRALNRAIVSARTVMVKDVAADMKLKSAAVRDRTKVREATSAQPIARLSASAKRLPLIDFGAKGPEPSRGKGRGVTARVAGSRGRYPQAFIATMKSGHRGVFQRKATPRLPIRELFGPSIWRVFVKFRAVGLARGREQLVKNLRSEFRYAARRTA